jgi:uncharacterized protein YndB with AHSA1/START domain
MKPDRRQVKASVLVPANPAQVYSALTNADAISAWFGAWTGCELSSVSVAPKVGGRLVIKSREKSGKEHWIKAQFIALRKNSHISAYWDSDFVCGFATQLHVDIEGEDRCCMVTFRHAGFEPDSEMAERHLRGWQGIGLTLARGIGRVDNHRK